MGRWEEPRCAQGGEGDERKQEPYCDVPMVGNIEDVNYHLFSSVLCVSDLRSPLLEGVTGSD